MHTKTGGWCSMKLRVSKKLSCKEGFYTYLFSDGYKGAKTYVLSGLLPEFPNNLWLDISFNENRLVTDFDIDYAAPATIKVFKNKDLDEYKKNVEFFKKTVCLRRKIVSSHSRQLNLKK